MTISFNSRYLLDITSQIENDSIFIDLKDSGSPVLIRDLSDKTIKMINSTEKTLISPKQKTFQDVINFRNQLDAQMLDLLNTINGNIPPVTGGENTLFARSIWDG